MLKGACEHYLKHLLKPLTRNLCCCTCRLSTICKLLPSCLPTICYFKLLSSPTTQLLGSHTGNNMASNAIKTCKLVNPKEEFLVDLDASIQENKLTLGSLVQIKQTILDNSNIIPDSFCSSLSQFTLHLPFNIQS